MRVPVSWLRTFVPGLTASADEIAAALVRAGLEVEQVHRVGHDITGVVTGRVLDVEELTGFKKPIRFCHVDVSSSYARGRLRRHQLRGRRHGRLRDPPVRYLPEGDFRIAPRTTYGHTSDGMICSEAELGLSGESDGILVLPPDTPLGEGRRRAARPS